MQTKNRFTNPKTALVYLSDFEHELQDAIKKSKTYREDSPDAMVAIFVILPELHIIDNRDAGIKLKYWTVQCIVTHPPEDEAIVLSSTCNFRASDTPESVGEEFGNTVGNHVHAFIVQEEADDE